VCYAIESYYQKLLKLDLQNDWIDSQIDLPYTNPVAMAYVASQNVLYIVYRSNSKISRYSLTTGTFLSEYSFSASEALDIQVGETMKRIVVLHSGSVSILDLDTGAVRLNAAAVAGASMALADAHGKLLTGSMYSSPSSLTRYSLEGDKLALEENLWSAGSNGRKVALSPDEMHLTLPCGGGNGSGYTLYDFNPYSLTQHFGEWDIGTYPMYSLFSHDGQYLYGTCGDPYDQNLYVMRANYQQVRKIPFPNANDYVLLCLNADGSELVGFSYDNYSNTKYRFYFFTDIRG
jgi:hypothetical protein